MFIWSKLYSETWQLYSETYILKLPELYSETSGIFGNSYSETRAVVFGNSDLHADGDSIRKLGRNCIRKLACGHRFGNSRWEASFSLRLCLALLGQLLCPRRQHLTGQLPNRRRFALPPRRAKSRAGGLPPPKAGAAKSSSRLPTSLQNSPQPRASRTSSSHASAPGPQKAAPRAWGRLGRCCEAAAASQSFSSSSHLLFASPASARPPWCTTPTSAGPPVAGPATAHGPLLRARSSEHPWSTRQLRRRT